MEYNYISQEKAVSCECKIFHKKFIWGGRGDPMYPYTRCPLDLRNYFLAACKLFPDLKKKKEKKD